MTDDSTLPYAGMPPSASGDNKQLHILLLLTLALFTTLAVEHAPWTWNFRSHWYFRTVTGSLGELFGIWDPLATVCNFVGPLTLATAAFLLCFRSTTARRRFFLIAALFVVITACLTFSMNSIEAIHDLLGGFDLPLTACLILRELAYLLDRCAFPFVVVAIHGLRRVPQPAVSESAFLRLMCGGALLYSLALIIWKGRVTMNLSQRLADGADLLEASRMIACGLATLLASVQLVAAIGGLWRFALLRHLLIGTASSLIVVLIAYDLVDTIQVLTLPRLPRMLLDFLAETAIISAFPAAMVLYLFRPRTRSLFSARTR